MDVIINSMIYTWLVIAIFFLMLEIGSPGLLFFISFSFGGLGAALAAIMTPIFALQIAAFFITTILAIIVLRYSVVPLIEKNRPHERTNVYALLGKRGIAHTYIYEKQSGTVKINGVVWAARSVQGDIYRDTEVEVVDIRGTHLIVKKAI